MTMPEEITRHHDESEVVYVGAHPTGYVVRIEEPDPTALAAVDEPGADHGALGFGQRYSKVKEPVVRQIYDRIFRAAGLL